MQSFAISFILFTITFTYLNAIAASDTLSTKVDSITLFLQSAQVERSGTMEIDTGISLLYIKGLSPYLDPSSVKVETNDDLTILSVDHAIDYLTDYENNDEIEKIESLLQSAKDSATTIKSKLENLKKISSILKNNQHLDENLTAENLEKLLQIHQEKNDKIAEKEIMHRSQLKEIEESIGRLKNQLLVLHNKPVEYFSQVIVKVQSEKNITAKFMLTYLVEHAGWVPRYNIRVDDISSPMEITYQANIFQNTQEDWTNVSLKFSNANPQESGSAPTLEKWLIDYASNTTFKSSHEDIVLGSTTKVEGFVRDQEGEPLIGATIIVKGSTIGTISDLDGKYSILVPAGNNTLEVTYVGFEKKSKAIQGPNMNFKMMPSHELSEVVVTGMGRVSRRMEGRAPGVEIERKQTRKTIETATVQSMAATYIKLEKPYSIPNHSNGYLLDIKILHIPAEYSYVTVPKKQLAAFIVAKIVDWPQYQLMEGEANLYFENAFVGKSLITMQTNDSLDISLGRDKNIFVRYRELHQYNDRKILSGNVAKTKKYEISVQNNKDQPISLEVLDQYPISVRDQIKSELLEDGGGTVDENTGIITWSLNIPGHDRAEVQFSYMIKHPQHQYVHLPGVARIN